MAAVHAVLAGQVPDAIPVDLTAGSWYCPFCDCILLVDLGPLDVEEWLAKTDHECHG